jgi:hypothetical protein
VQALPRTFRAGRPLPHAVEVTRQYSYVLLLGWGGGAQHASKDQEWRTHWVDATEHAGREPRDGSTHWGDVTEHAGREPVDGKTNDLEWPCSLDTQKTSTTACYINADPTIRCMH